MRNMRSCGRIDSSFIIAHPVNSDLHTWERRSLKCYIYMYIYMTFLIIDLDFLYHFNLGLIAPLFTVSFHEMFEIFFFFNFQKLAGLWLVGEVDNHVAIYGSKVAEGFSAFQRRSCFICNICVENIQSAMSRHHTMAFSYFSSIGMYMVSCQERVKDLAVSCEG